MAFGVRGWQGTLRRIPSQKGARYRIGARTRAPQDLLIHLGESEMANTNFARDGFIPTSRDVSIETFTAERVNLYVQKELSEYAGMASNMETEILKSVIGSTVYLFKTWCVSGRIEDSYELKSVQYPDGVWQMFKSKYIPRWFVNRFPVRMHREEFKKVLNHYFVCPHLVTDPQSKHVQFMATGTRIASMMHPEDWRL
jgi:hypothetical protein